MDLLSDVLLCDSKIVPSILPLSPKYTNSPRYFKCLRPHKIKMYNNIHNPAIKHFEYFNEGKTKWSCKKEKLITFNLVAIFFKKLIKIVLWNVFSKFLDITICCCACGGNRPETLGSGGKRQWLYAQKRTKITFPQAITLRCTKV